ncbi:MAG: class I SAM-dependent methyltransferase, partial [Caldilineaceae bacterium]
LHRQVTCRTADAVAAAEAYATAQRQFGFVFVDHSHAYEPVYGVCRVLDQIIAPGGFCLFHDYNDIRNADPEDKEYGVYQAVVDGLNLDAFEFYGIFGCCGLYRRAPR